MYTSLARLVVLPEVALRPVRTSPQVARGSGGEQSQERVLEADRSVVADGGPERGPDRGGGGQRKIHPHVRAPVFQSITTAVVEKSVGVGQFWELPSTGCRTWPAVDLLGVAYTS